MANKFRFGPLALTTTLTTNLLNPPTTTGGVNPPTSTVFLVLKHLRIVNKTALPATFSLWLGATAGNVAGTEVIGNGVSVAAHSFFDYYSPGLLIEAADFLVGGSDTATALTIEGEGDVEITG